MLGTELKKCSPTELINLLLKMPVELLWNGGIGTYVKASDEGHDDAQDKANDVLRVSANELSCKVIGEGGNLGMTQKARIEFSQLGGCCYTDAIDNSAGVDTSDHEVNLKILLNQQLAEGKLSLEERNVILAEMEEEVGLLVLQNNYAQTQTLGVEVHYADQLMPHHVGAIKMLAERGLDREIEYLPDDAELVARNESGHTLTAPELAVVLSYSKMDLYGDMLKSSLPDEEALLGELEAYFPKVINQRFQVEMVAHRLKREIISTHLTNRFIAQMGPTFHLRISALTAKTGSQIAKSWFVTQAIMKSDALVADIQALDNQIDSSEQIALLFEVAMMMQNAVVWLLAKQADNDDIQITIASYKPLVQAVLDKLPDYLSAEAIGALQAHKQRLINNGLQSDLAEKIARLNYCTPALEIAGITEGAKSLAATADIYFQLSHELGVQWVTTAINGLDIQNQWHERAQFALASDLSNHHAAITQQILVEAAACSKSVQANELVANWMQQKQTAMQIFRVTAEQLKSQEKADFAMLSVLMSALSQLV